jgi:hypothetical protein
MERIPARKNAAKDQTRNRTCIVVLVAHASADHPARAQRT